MKIAEYKQTGTRTESYTVTIPAEYDEEGNLISEEHEETRTREVPVMGMVYRDMTPEEIAELEKIQRFFNLRLYTAKQMHKFAEKGVITPEQYKQITGEEY